MMSRNKRLTIRSKRWHIIKRDDKKCQYCGIKTSKNVPQSDSTFMTFDHIIPRSRGGHPTSEVNIVVCCALCNANKSDSMPWEINMWPRNGLGGCWKPSKVDSSRSKYI